MNDYLYKPLNKEQRDLVDKLTENLDQQFFIEKRNLDMEYRPGILIPGGQSGKAVKVMVSDENHQVDGRVLLCHKSFYTMNPAELICELRTGEQIRIRGWAEATRPGRRAQDRFQRPSIQVSFFHPRRL